MMAGVTEDHAQHAGAVGHERHGHPTDTGRSLMQELRHIQRQHRHIGDLMADEQTQIDRLNTDVGNYVTAMRGQVQSLKDQLAAVQGQVSTAAADQMSADAQGLSDTLDKLEAAFAQDNPPAAPATPADPGTGTDPNAPAARRR
jgi:hypothetical protein